jgi:ABC-2 type transport system permease protein
MRNIIKADLYRILRGKGVYITLIIFLGIILLQVVTGGVMNTGVSYDNYEAVNTAEDEFDLEAIMAEMFRKPTGAEAPFKAMSATDSLLYILLPLLVFITVADFTSGAAKNTLINGVTRGKYFASKLLLSSMACVALLVMYVVISTLAATLISGFGGTFDSEFLWSVGRIMLVQAGLCLAMTCVGTFFAFLARSNAVIGIYIAFLLGFQVLIFALTFVSDWFMNLFDYELTWNLGKAAHLDALASSEVTQMLLAGAVYMIASIIGGYALFRKAEVK